MEEGTGDIFLSWDQPPYSKTSANSWWRKDNTGVPYIQLLFGFLLRLLGERGDVVRARLRKLKALRLKGRKPVAKVYSQDEKQRLIQAAREARSPVIYPALMVALHTGMRSSEIRNLQWLQIDFNRCYLTVGSSKDRSR